MIINKHIDHMCLSGVWGYGPWYREVYAHINNTHTNIYHNANEVNLIVYYELIPMILPCIREIINNDRSKTNTS